MSVTSHDVARLAGVSQPTVSRALRQDSQVSTATRERVRVAAEQLGYVPSELGRSLSTRSTRQIAMVADLDNPLYPQLVGPLHDAFAAQGFNRKNLAAIDNAYAQNVRWNAETNRTGYGCGEVKGMARMLMSTFPDLGLHIDEIYWMGNDADGYSVSVRWSASGTHRGYGLYGKPTGRRIFLWGLNQLYYQGGKIVEDWMLFNEMDVMPQILKDEATDLLA